jgi:hypothetical protein
MASVRQLHVAIRSSLSGQLISSMDGPNPPVFDASRWTKLSPSQESP